MIINNFYFKRVTISPYETNPILIIYADAMLTLTITLQGFQTIPWKDRQITQRVGGVRIERAYVERLWKSAKAVAPCDR